MATSALDILDVWTNSQILVGVEHVNSTPAMPGTMSAVIVMTETGEVCCPPLTSCVHCTW